MRITSESSFSCAAFSAYGTDAAYAFEEEERPEAASNAVKLQRPAKGYRVQSLPSGIRPPFPFCV
jgi:hypothetical protein